MLDFSHIKPGECRQIAGIIGAGGALVLSRLAAASPHPLLIVASDSRDAERWEEDLRFFLPPEIPLFLFPSLDILPYHSLSPNPERVMERLKILWHLLSLHKPFVVIAPLSALLRKLIPRNVLERESLFLEAGLTFPHAQLTERLVALAYQRTPLVEDRGTFAVRGGLIDIFSPAHDHPVRLEFFGETIESIRFFDPVTQKSLGPADQVTLLPAREVLLSQLRGDWKSFLKKRGDENDIPKGERDAVAEYFSKGIHFNGIETCLPLFYSTPGILPDYLPSQTVICFSDRKELTKKQTLFLSEIFDTRSRSKRAETIFAPDELFMNASETEEALSYFPQIDFCSSPSPDQPSTFMAMESNNLFGSQIQAKIATEKALEPLALELDRRRREGTQIFLVAGSPIQEERMVDLLSRHDLPLVRGAPNFALSASVQVVRGPISGGFVWPEAKQWWLTDEEIFGRKARKKAQPAERDVFSSFAELSPGDYVVHQDQGVGLYRGLKALEIGQINPSTRSRSLRVDASTSLSIQNDFLLLEYLGGDKLYVPVDQLNRLSRYAAPEGVHPVLDKMGGAGWLRAKERVKKAARRLARQLLEIEAAREVAKGHPFGPRNALFEEFEATFPFEETAHQLKAIEEVLHDMESLRPMDRLVCGDVGYGKTEVAIRAAFKAALDSKQVALLVPTTVLAFQHYENFKKRFEAYPVTVAFLSRFESAKEQKKIIEGLGKGSIDVVIGTHRLLSTDVKFRDLGLLIIDEEQHFGVAQKEKVKRLKSTVDVLTLSATPIPRTLNFALVGIRNLSLINTPPADRLSINTYITHFDPTTLREAILREVKRGGQIFFVHNRIQTIKGVEEKLKKIVPEIRIKIAHGQLPEKELEEVMIDFMQRRFELLLCTTIIESGLDIPNANTILINRADEMGLSQLYQLRGRVGRSFHRAFCYLIIPHDVPLSDIAKKRLSVIERFTELGSGFRVASHDLEIRGAGNILGAEQSGHMAAIGYDLYVKLLAEAVAELKGEEVEEEIDTEIKLPVAASIPETMIPDTQLRLVLYRQASQAKNEEECLAIREEWVDRFGALPPSVENLISLIRVKVLARALKITSVVLQKEGFVYQVHPQSPIPTSYFLERFRREPNKCRILPDGKFLIRELVEGEEEILQTARRHLMEMSG